MKFTDLDLVAPLLKAVAEAGYDTPTPIQEQAIPPLLKGRDVIGCAQTGTGKTAAFSLPILQHIDKVAGDDPKIRALIITPTRELASQIGDSLATYGKHLDLWHTVIFGGVKQGAQVKALRAGVDMVVATPGRLLDLLNQGELHLKDIELFVLDEADRMLDMGFLPDVRRIIAQLPAKRQTLFFSATMPPEISQLAQTLLHDPVSVAVAPVSSTAEEIVQHLYFVDKPDKPKLLRDLLTQAEIVKTLVFTRTKHGANRVVRTLEKSGFRAAAIHGNRSQNARERALNGFRSGDVDVLVATDIAARGIDVDGITHVINFDLPNIPETYVHRIGRTGRAGASGIALSFCQEDERPYLVDIERLIGLHIDRVLDHEYKASTPPPRETDLAGKGKRASGPPRRSSGGGRGRNNRPRRDGGGGGGRSGNRR
jgi:ATP-dependent RNA helicase RhlE